jgi:hypothetical protein
VWSLAVCKKTNSTPLHPVGQKGGSLWEKPGVDGHVRTLNDTQLDANNKDVDKNLRYLIFTNQRNWR